MKNKEDTLLEQLQNLYKSGRNRIHTTNTRIDDCYRSWLATCTTITSCEDKLVLFGPTPYM